MHPLVKPLGGVLGSSATIISPLTGLLSVPSPRRDVSAPSVAKAFARLRTIWQSSE